MNRDPLLWAALAAVLVVLASAEYELAVACGFGPYVAAGVPAALDVYALAALRARRDVLVVVAVLIAVNGASHLVEVGLLPVNVPLVVAVSAIAPLVLWRVHRLSEHPPAPAVSPVPEAYPAAEVHRDEPAPERVDEVPVLPVLGPFASLHELPLTRPYPAVYPAADQDGHERPDDDVTASDTGSGTRDTPHPHADDVEDDLDEDELTATARDDFAELLDGGRPPSIRALRDTYSIGQPRAQRIQAELAGS
ncbi:hypothetical protein [Streptomyces sp. NPDC058254]|uniref:hypothetical protein n=1 Tax=Streptomyces sp. NPDC058254 TaxID=3346406 RepID=UPI0036E062D9